MENITFSFPVELIKRLKKKTKSGEMSQYVANAVRLKLEFEERQKLRNELIEGYQGRFKEDREIANEFFDAEEEAYQRYLANG